MNRHRLLLVEDDEETRFPIRRYFERNGFAVLEADSLASARTVCQAAAPDIVVLDHGLPDGDGLAVLEILRRIDPSVPVIVLTGRGSVELAVQAIKAGAEQFLTKPVELKALHVLVERLIAARRSVRLGEAARAREQRSEVDPFRGQSPGMRSLREHAERLAQSHVPLLLLGETGTGKGVLAAWLHRHGPRRAEAFVDVNCAGLSHELLQSQLFGHRKGAFTGATESKPGLLEAAHRGTLFLDEIGDMSLEVQPQLLKVLEEQRFRRLGDVHEHRVDVRLIAATHHDLLERSDAGLFRKDLLYRIETMTLTLPPLRERGHDAIILARDMVRRLAAELARPGLALSESAELALLEHDWPGNVRELRNVLERMALMAHDDMLEQCDVRGAVGGGNRPTHDRVSTLREVERRHIAYALQRYHGDVATTAQALGVSRSALYKKLRKHDIPPPKRGDGRLDFETGTLDFETAD